MAAAPLATCSAPASLLRCGRGVSLSFSRSHVGYLPFEGRQRRDTLGTRFATQRRMVNLSPVKRIVVSFDPFRRDVKGIRMAMHALSNEKVRATNLKCLHKTEVLSDGGEPTLRLELNEGKDILFKTANLTGLEVLFQLNKMVLPLVVEKTEVRETKSEKKGKKKK